MSLLAKGTRLGRPWPRPVPTRPPFAMPNKALDNLEAAAELPAVDLMAVKALSQPSIRRATCENTWAATKPPTTIRTEADDDPADAACGDVDHDEEQAEEQDRGTEVALEDEHADAHEPGGDHGAPMSLQPRELHRADLAAGQQDQVPVRGQIPGKEDGQGDLGDFTGLEGHGTDLDPHARTQDFSGGDTGHQRQDEEHGADAPGRCT